jgi:hypothetical protein
VECDPEESRKGRWLFVKRKHREGPNSKEGSKLILVSVSSLEAGVERLQGFREA